MVERMEPELRFERAGHSCVVKLSTIDGITWHADAFVDGRHVKGVSGTIPGGGLMLGVAAAGNAVDRLQC